VIQTKQHLAVLVPSGPGLVLNLLRWGADIRSWKDLPLPAEGVKAAGLSERELKMAGELVEDMSSEWDPDEFKDSFKDEIMRLIDQKVAAGDTESVTQPEPSEEGVSGGAKILDLTELLQRSLRKGGKAAKGSDADEEDDEAPARSAKSKPAAKSSAKAGKAAKTPARKTAASKAPAKAPAKRRAA
jgi:DNA end-binding protein Ku